MAMNRIQFQPGLSLAGFLQQYGTEAACARALRRARWPKGFVCPRCGGRRYGQDSGAPLAGGRSPLQSLARAAFARHPHHRRRLNFSANQVLTSIEDYGPTCGFVRDVFSPGLMPGLGGVAYQLLRSNRESNLPSILTLGADF